VENAALWAAPFERVGYVNGTACSDS
jgi:hypothetical protein